jgi:hypothetical protein
MIMDLVIVLTLEYIFDDCACKTYMEHNNVCISKKKQVIKFNCMTNIQLTEYPNLMMLRLYVHIIPNLHLYLFNGIKYLYMSECRLK